MGRNEKRKTELGDLFVKNGLIILATIMLFLSGFLLVNSFQSKSEAINDFEKQVEDLKDELIKFKDTNKNLKFKNEEYEKIISEYKNKETEVKEELFLNESNNILKYIKNKDFEKLFENVVPEGLRLSMSPSIDLVNDKVFTKDSFINYFNNGEILNFGVHPSTGLSEEVSLSEYYNKYIYDTEYLLPHNIGINHFIGNSNAYNNILETYQDSIVVEYHFTGFDPQFGGMDWKSLMLDFVVRDGKYYLQGIIHSSWTP